MQRAIELEMLVCFGVSDGKLKAIQNLVADDIPPACVSCVKRSSMIYVQIMWGCDQVKGSTCLAQCFLKAACKHHYIHLFGTKGDFRTMPSTAWQKIHSNFEALHREGEWRPTTGLRFQSQRQLAWSSTKILSFRAWSLLFDESTVNSSYNI